MSASLRTGPRALQGSEGRVAVVTLVDLPDLPDLHADVVRRVLVRLGTEPTVLGRPCFGGRPGARDYLRCQRGRDRVR